MKTFVSVIICTYNRAPLLQRALKSLSCQTLPPDQFEIIVVDDGSTDNTDEVCERMRQEMPNMRYRPTGRNTGISSAANIGVQSAKGDYLIFTDDDCIAGRDWAECMLNALIKYPLIAGGVKSPTSNFVKYCHNIAEFHPFMWDRREGPIDFIAGANMGFRRSLFEEVQGFRDADSLAPDMHFILKARQAGYQIYFIPEAVVMHDHTRTSLSSIFRYSAEHASATIILRNRFRQLMGTPFVLRSPVLLLAVSPVIALKVTAGIYVKNRNQTKIIWTVPVVFALKLAWCWGAARGLRKWNESGRKHEQEN